MATLKPVDPTAATLVLRSDANHVTTLTLNRPQARNALSRELIAALQVALDAIALDTSVHVVVLAGAGPAFCAGHDLKDIRAADYAPDYAEVLFEACAQLMQRIVSLPQPVIAKIHGIATAAGAQLVASCDLAVATDTARFATPGVNIGLFCSTPMVALSRNISHKHTMQMLLTGELIDAATALRFGLINEAVPEALLDAAVTTLTDKIASKSRYTLAIGKAAFYQQAELPLTQAYDYAKGVMVANLQAHDAQEGIGAFIDKRTPIWCHGNAT
jgi:enoyl-CoA hydratase/carnithine racemase